MDRFFTRFVGQTGDIAKTLLEEGFFKFNEPIDQSFCKNLLGDRIESVTQSRYISGATEVQALLDELGADTLARGIADKLEEQLGIELIRGRNHHVLRSVRPGDVGEAFRGHFDSHALTVLIPLQIPSGYQEGRGELFFSSLTRRWPRSEVENLIGKFIWKLKLAILGSESTLKGLPRLRKFNFDDGCPIIFLGKVCFHGNYPLYSSTAGFRHTLLAHFFDDSGPLSVSELIRRLRKRGA